MNAVQPCAREAEALEVVIVGENDAPVADVLVELRNARGAAIRDRTTVGGSCRFEGLPAGEYTLVLPLLDRDAWAELAAEALPPERAASEGEARWEAATPAPEAFTHTVQPGECVASIGYRHGLLPATIWNAPENATLRSKRASLYILFEHDPLFIPAPRLRSVPAAAGTLYRLRRKGVPEKLRVRLLDEDDRPRSGLPFLLSIETEKGRPVADELGTTTAAGMVEADIPPDAIRGRILLQLPEYAEAIDVRIGTIDPVDEIRGLQERLRNLAFDCGTEDGELGDATRAALEQFQRAYGLEATGEDDAPTREKLLELHQS